MKQTLVIALIVFIAFGCNNKSSNTADTASTDTSSTSAAMGSLDYPYALDQPYREWQPGDQQHAVNVMKSLKAYENGNIDACIAAFGDSVELRFDGYWDKLSKDSLKKMLTKSRGDLAALTVKMGDWESVISKDKMHEYVTLWYKEIQTDKKGKTDSLSIVDDLKIVNGKIVELDQKIQHFPAVNKK